MLLKEFNNKRISFKYPSNYKDITDKITEHNTPFLVLENENDLVIIFNKEIVGNLSFKELVRKRKKQYFNSGKPMNKLHDITINENRIFKIDSRDYKGISCFYYFVKNNIEYSLVISGGENMAVIEKDLNIILKTFIIF